jgi:transcriptional/translational regulatory protein YebC/TACO1
LVSNLVYEGFARAPRPMIVEYLSDNINRTMSSMRVLFRKGQLGAEALSRGIQATSA